MLSDRYRTISNRYSQNKDTTTHRNQETPLTDTTQWILAGAKRGKLSSIKDILSGEDVSCVWDHVSSHIEKQLSAQKGVVIEGLGTFALSQQKLGNGNGKFSLARQPVFNISKKFTQAHGLQYQRCEVSGSIPALPLNYASVSVASNYDRDVVERCTKEIIRSLARVVASTPHVVLCFSGVGRLIVREGRVNMKFYEEFINQMDCSGKLVALMIKRAETADAEMTDRMYHNPQSTKTIIIPKVNTCNSTEPRHSMSPMCGNITNCMAPMYDNKRNSMSPMYGTPRNSMSPMCGTPRNSMSPMCGTPRNSMSPMCGTPRNSMSPMCGTPRNMYDMPSNTHEEEDCISVDGLSWPQLDIKGRDACSRLLMNQQFPLTTS